MPVWARVAVIPDGNDPVDRFTVELNPLPGAIVIVLAPDVPGIIVRLAGDALSAKVVGEETVKLKTVVVVIVTPRLTV
jgi:hypothetical protein